MPGLIDDKVSYAVDIPDGDTTHVAVRHVSQSTDRPKGERTVLYSVNHYCEYTG